MIHQVCGCQTGVILVVRPPFLFPQDMLCHHGKQINDTFYEDGSLVKSKTYWIGVGMSLGAASIGGLNNVSISYLKVQ